MKCKECGELIQIREVHTLTWISLIDESYDPEDVFKDKPNLANQKLIEEIVIECSKNKEHDCGYIWDDKIAKIAQINRMDYKRCDYCGNWVAEIQSGLCPKCAANYAYIPR